jgi:hypothetical protein
MRLIERLDGPLVWRPSPRLLLAPSGREEQKADRGECRDSRDYGKSEKKAAAARGSPMASTADARVTDERLDGAEASTADSGLGERDLPVLGVHEHGVAGDEVGREQVLSERIFDQALDGALERAGAEGRIPAGLDDHLFGRAR